MQLSKKSTHEHTINIVVVPNALQVLVTYMYRKLDSAVADLL